MYFDVQYPACRLEHCSQVEFPWRFYFFKKASISRNDFKILLFLKLAFRFKMFLKNAIKICFKCSRSKVSVGTWNCLLLHCIIAFFLTNESSHVSGEFTTPVICSIIATQMDSRPDLPTNC